MKSLLKKLFKKIVLKHFIDSTSRRLAAFGDMEIFMTLTSSGH